MLDIAINHEAELINKFRTIWFHEKYKYYNYFTYFSDFKVDTDSWVKHQFVSLDNSGNVTGFIGYNINRETHNCHNLNIINFSDDRTTFARDLKQVLVDIFEKFKFNKLKFSVVIGNPIEKSYDKIINRYGGRIVGIEEKEVKLFDGEYYDEKIYEITRRNYELARNSQRNVNECTKTIGKYKVITLCGSTKFKYEFIKAQKELTLAGNIVISVGLFGHSGDNEVWDDGIKEMLDDMHKKKIDMADEIMIIDVNNYYGKSTQNEIEYAISKGKPVNFYNHPEKYYDEVGGFHDSALGWNPNGVFCGECTMESCKNCKYRDNIQK